MIGLMRKIPGAPELRGRMYSRSVLDALPIYRGRFCGSSPVDFLRYFVGANVKGYQWRGFSIPDTNRQSFAPRGQMEDQISVPAGSFLISISQVSDSVAGMDWLLTDKGTKQQLSSQECRSVAESGGLGLRFPTRPLPFYLPAAWTVSKAGLLTVKMTNLDVGPGNTNMNLFLQFASRI